MIYYICRSLRSLTLKNPSLSNKPHVSFAPTALFSSSVRQSKPNPIPTFAYLTERHHLSSEAALKASQSLAYIKDPENSDSVMSFLKQNGFTNSHIEIVVRRMPQLLSSDTENTLKPKLKIFQDFGFSPDDIVEILSADPWIFRKGASRITSSIGALKNVLGSINSVKKVLKLLTWFASHDLEKTTVPSIEYMKSCGISSSQISTYLLSFPRLFMHKPENIEYFVKKADEMGCDRNSKMFISAVRVLSSMSNETWEQKLQLFRDLGYSDKDIRYMFQKAPQVFASSEKKLTNSTKLLLSINNGDISYLVRNQRLLLCSVESVLKPRLAVMEILERKNIIQKRPNLATLFTKSHQKFMEKYVIPYSNEVGSVYMNRNI